MPTCSTRTLPPYESGRIVYGDMRLLRPGGLALTERAIALAQLDAGANVLDVGCGAGDTVRYLQKQGYHAIGVDRISDPVAAGNSCDIERVIARAESLPFADNSAQGILAECSVSLFEDRTRCLAEFARVLVDGGRLMISDLYARRPEAIAGVRELRGSCVAAMLVQEELEASLLTTGFSVDVWEDHSRALRECAARYIFERGSLDEMWGCDHAASSVLREAMHSARAGYFLLIATRRNRNGHRSTSHE